MAISSFGYDGTLSELPWAKMWELMGNVPVVRGSGDFATTYRTGVDRTVRVAAGEAAGKGVYDISDGFIDIALPTTSGSPKWTTIVIRRDWSGTAGTTTVVPVLGGSTQAVAAGLNNIPGVLHDTPIALVRVSPGVQVPDGGAAGVQPIDLRVPLTAAQTGILTVASIKTKPTTKVILDNGSWTTLDGLTTEYTTGAGWGYASGVWTLPIDGLYDLAAMIGYDAGSGVGAVGARYVLNPGGKVVAQEIKGNDGVNGALSIAGTIYATAGQTVTIQCFSSDTGGSNMGATQSGVPAWLSLKCVAANPALLSS